MAMVAVVAMMAVMVVMAVIMIVGYAGDDCVDFEGYGDGIDCGLSTALMVAVVTKMRVKAVMTVTAMKIVMVRMTV